MIFILAFFFNTGKVFAAENFATGYDITYTVLPNGITHAEFQIGITNKTGQYAASSYKVKLGFRSISNVKVFDKTTVFDPTIEKGDASTTVGVSFPDKIAGKNNTRSFTLVFDTDEVAKKRGSVWEINIPGLSKNESFSKFDVHLLYPESFGTPTYVKPFIGSSLKNRYDFTKDKLGRSGISLTFGKNQQYKFNLSYHLKNNNLFPITTEIALPPDTNYQNIIIDTISDKPENVYKDKDGNYLARYYLFPSETKDIVVKGRVKINLTPKTEELTQNEIREYTKELPFWQTNDSKIKETAQKLKTPSAIYEYVVKNLTYDFTRVTQEKERVGAKDVLQNPTSAACLEFTDLFIALARSAGIPARELDGFAFTDNEKERPLSLLKDVLHAWPEYYDFEKKTWVMVDPTWGNTTGGVDYFNVLDFDHIAFAIRGTESTYPVPAGGYKLRREIGIKDVIVVPSETEWDFHPRVDLQLKLPKVAIAGLPIYGTITVKNTGGSAIPKQTIYIESNLLFPKKQNVTFPETPPYGESTIPFNFDSMFFLTNSNSRVTIVLYDKGITQDIVVAPFYKIGWVVIGGVFSVLFIIGLFVITTRARYLFLPR